MSNAKPKYRLFTVEGHSMNRAGLLDGMRVRVRAAETADSGQVVAVRDAEGGVVIKRLWRGRDGGWLVPESTDRTLEARRFLPGECIIGIVLDVPERPWRHLIEPPFVVRASAIAQPVYAKAPEPAGPPSRPAPPPPPTAPPATPEPEEPPPRVRLAFRVLRYPPGPRQVVRCFAGVVGEHDPIDVFSEQRVLVPADLAAGAAYCVVQGSASLAGLGVRLGDLLFVREAVSMTRRRTFFPTWRPGDVVIASVDGVAFAGELHRDGDRLRVRSNSGGPEALQASVDVTAQNILGVVLCAEG